MILLRWSVEECKRQNVSLNSEVQRKILGRALDLIRFPLMTIEEFAQGPAQTDLLTDADKVQMFLYYVVRNWSSFNIVLI